jgi:hypothetical protein
MERGNGTIETSNANRQSLPGIEIEEAISTLRISISGIDAVPCVGVSLRRVAALVYPGQRTISQSDWVDVANFLQTPASPICGYSAGALIMN